MNGDDTFHHQRLKETLLQLPNGKCNKDKLKRNTVIRSLKRKSHFLFASNTNGYLFISQIVCIFTKIVLSMRAYMYDKILKLLTGNFKHVNLYYHTNKLPSACGLFLA